MVKNVGIKYAMRDLSILIIEIFTMCMGYFTQFSAYRTTKENFPCT